MIIFYKRYQRHREQLLKQPDVEAIIETNARDLPAQNCNAEFSDVEAVNVSCQIIETNRNTDSMSQKNRKKDIRDWFNNSADRGFSPKVVAIAHPIEILDQARQIQVMQNCNNRNSRSL